MPKCYNCEYNKRMTRFTDNRNMSGGNKKYLVACKETTVIFDPSDDSAPLNCYKADLGYKNYMKTLVKHKVKLLKAKINYYKGY